MNKKLLFMFIYLLTALLIARAITKKLEPTYDVQTSEPLDFGVIPLPSDLGAAQE